MKRWQLWLFKLGFSLANVFLLRGWIGASFWQYMAVNLLALYSMDVVVAWMAFIARTDKARSTSEAGP